MVSNEIFKRKKTERFIRLERELELKKDTKNMLYTPIVGCMTMSLPTGHV